MKCIVVSVFSDNLLAISVVLIAYLKDRTAIPLITKVAILYPAFFAYMVLGVAEG